MKVFLIDDSIVMRQGMTQALKGIPGVEVIGSASHGISALAQLERLSVDLVIVDLEMPEMDGISFIKEFRKKNPRTKILVFSAFSERGARITIDALLAGANDFLQKSFGKGKPGEDPVSLLREALHPKVTQFQSVDDLPEKILSESRKATISSRAPTASSIRAIAIGSSTGGPDALKQVLSALSPSLHLPVFVTQHMPALFTAELARMMQKTCALKVKEASHGEVAEPGVVYIAPGDFHMEVHEQSGQVKIRLNQEAKENFVRPAFDVFLRSAGPVYNGNMPVIVLTGMGEDGLKGVVQIKNLGTFVIVQDKESSVVWGMPGAVFRAGLHDLCLPLNKIGAEIGVLTGTAKPVREAV